MPFLERNNATIFYEFNRAESEKAVLTLVNGHTRSSSDFRAMSRRFSDAGISTIVLDNRASGKSTVSASFTLNDMKEDVVAIWDAVGIDSSFILGISMGGFICQLLASEYQNRVKGLLLVSTASDERWINHSEGSWSLDGDEIEKKLSAYFAPKFLDSNKLLVSTMVKQTRIAIQENQFLDRADYQRAALKAHGSKPDLSKIKCPTLIVHGREDRIIDAQAAHEFAALIAGSDVVIYEDVGHLILAESPKKLFEDCLEFIEKNR